MDKVFFCLVLIFSFFTSLQAMEVQINVEYGKVGSEPLQLDIYSPKVDGYFAGVVIVHGGGWSGGDKRADITGLFEPLADANMVCYSVNYRLAPQNKWPACFDDVLTAIKWVRANALKYKTDPNRIALLGYSAGGQLAMLAAMKTHSETNVRAAVALAAPTDLVLDSLRRKDISSYLVALRGSDVVDSNTVQWIWELSPINYIRPQAVPVLLVHGTLDDTVPYQQSLNFKQRIIDVGGTCDMIEIKDAPHKIAEWENYDKEYQKKIAQWLKEQLKYRHEDANTPSK